MVYFASGSDEDLHVLEEGEEKENPQMSCKMNLRTDKMLPKRLLPAPKDRDSRYS